MQAAAALALVLLIVGGVGLAVDVRVQNRQIDGQLVSVATTADDVTDPPPGMILAIRNANGGMSASAHADEATQLLSGPDGFADVEIDGRDQRAYVVDTARGRIAAVLDLQPYRASRSRLLVSLGIAELVGILASVAVVTMLTRRSIRPLSQALALQRRFVADASHELRAPLTVLHTRAHLLARRPDVCHQRPGGTVTVRPYRNDTSVGIDVRDDGVGVDPATIDRLFERFAHGDHAGGGQRYGIGLALVREIAQAHGGDVSVTPTPGGGATFTLTFPRAHFG